MSCAMYWLAWNKETQWQRTPAVPPPWLTPYPGTSRSHHHGHRDPLWPCAPGPGRRIRWGTHHAVGRAERTFTPTLHLANSIYSRLAFISDNKSPTFPFSNLLTLFLLVIMGRSPVSPRSPNRLRNTVASVPLPLTSPVQIVTRYFITEERNRDSVGH